MAQYALESHRPHTSPRPRVKVRKHRVNDVVHKGVSRLTVKRYGTLSALPSIPPDRVPRPKCLTPDTQGSPSTIYAAYLAWRIFAGWLLSVVRSSGNSHSQKDAFNPQADARRPAYMGPSNSPTMWPNTTR